ncbi:hypothetical protein [Adhaeribacter aquaticus]|uniref:hypothetical protein n=1 Tax=Adhaeribacter aquaticus TaxID=299567 RepID=UPI0004199D32|nr:hypothetical protein [Adhaeribacter aquaticus]
MKIMNNSVLLTNYTNLEEAIGNRWIAENTAILVVHGIGNQNPLETLDGFTRGLAETYKAAGYNLAIEHHLARKSASDSSTPWFDNFLRLREEGTQGPHLDIYEYYWAHETEGQATLKDLNTWLNNVTRGARKFYKNNVVFANANEDQSIFIKDGKFNPVTYWFCVSFIPQLFLFLNWAIDALVKLFSAIPVIGPFVSLFFQGKLNGTLDKLSNILNDISIYNTTDAKSKFFVFGIAFWMVL